MTTTFRNLGDRFLGRVPLPYGGADGVTVSKRKAAQLRGLVARVEGAATPDGAAAVVGELASSYRGRDSGRRVWLEHAGLEAPERKAFLRAVTPTLVKRAALTDAQWLSAESWVAHQDYDAPVETLQALSRRLEHVLSIGTPAWNRERDRLAKALEDSEAAFAETVGGPHGMTWMYRRDFARGELKAWTSREVPSDADLRDALRSAAEVQRALPSESPARPGVKKEIERLNALRSELNTGGRARDSFGA